MSKLFISHSTADRKFVEDELIGILKALGFGVWFAEDDVKTPEDWQRSIQKGLEACPWFLLVMSPNSAESPSVKDELGWAMRERRGRIIPILIGDCKSDSFHIGLASIQYIDYRNDQRRAREELIKLLVDAEYKKLKSGYVFANFHDAIPLIDQLIRQGFSDKKRTRTTLWVIGLGGQHTWDVLRRHVIGDGGRLRKTVKNFEYTIFMVAAKEPGPVDELARAADLRAKEIDAFKEIHAQDLAEQNIVIRYGRYYHLPAFHGTFVNEQHLFLAHTYWIDRDALEGLTVPHIYFNKDEAPVGSHYAEYFESWWRYLAKKHENDWCSP